MAKLTDEQIVDFFERAVSGLDDRIRLIGQEQWELPTPRTKWDLRALIKHLVYQVSWVQPLLGGLTLEQVGKRFEGDILRDDPIGAWAGARDGAKLAVSRPKALETEVRLSRGKIPARDYVTEIWIDALIHTWDVARAANLDEGLDQELVKAAYEILKPHEQEMRKPADYGKEVKVSSGADMQTKFLALAGRKA